MEARTGWRKALRILGPALSGPVLPLGRISDRFQVKGQIKSTSEGRDKAKEGPRSVPGGTPVQAQKDRKNLQPQLEIRTGVLWGPVPGRIRGPVVSRRILMNSH